MGDTRGIRAARSRPFPSALVVALIFSTFTPAKPNSIDFFDCLDGKYLDENAGTQRFDHVSIEECAQKCVEGTSDRLREGQCLSFNYDKPKHQCTVIAANRATIDPFHHELINYREYEYCEMKDILSFFIARPGYMQAGHDDATVRPSEVTPRICALRCLRGADNVPAGFCLSFDMASTHPDSCLLSRASPATTGLPLVSNPRFNYYQRNIDACFNDPCVHGYCTSQENRINCICDTGWGGETCDTVCFLGTFGSGCSQTCHCAGGISVCNIQSGECSTGGCTAGWSGPNCQTACPSGQFGLACAGTCHCASGGSVCDTETGVCSSGGCSAGWEGSNCQTKDFCAPNRYRCINGDCVNQANGYTCSCHAGWQGTNCDAACAAGTFGLECAQTCHCADGMSVCDVQTGECSSGGCTAGWSGSNCQTACLPGQFGPGCNGTCHCASGGSVCDTETGNCSSGGCSAGWEGSNCQRVCDPGSFGPGCSSTCHCANGASVCVHETGVCASGGCAAGWQGNNCQTACPPGQFGPGCNGTCHCARGGSVCDPETGNCSSGGCSAGWEGSNCQTDVNECSTHADSCHNKATCVNTEGSYACTCDPGYQGDGVLCTAEHLESADGLTVGDIASIVTGVILVVVAIVAAVCIIRYCRARPGGFTVIAHYETEQWNNLQHCKITHHAG